MVVTFWSRASDFGDCATTRKMAHCKLWLYINIVNNFIYWSLSYNFFISPKPENMSRLIVGRSSCALIQHWYNHLLADIFGEKKPNQSGWWFQVSTCFMYFHVGLSEHSGPNFDGLSSFSRILPGHNLRFTPPSFQTLKRCVQATFETNLTWDHLPSGKLT